MVEKKEGMKAIKEKGVWRVMKMYNMLCRKCRRRSLVLARVGKQDKAYDQYCDDCKKRLKELWEK